LDWPRNRSSQEAQKQELLSMLDHLQKYHFNTVLFQVPGNRGDGRFYHSNIEPMSSWLLPEATDVLRSIRWR